MAKALSPHQTFVCTIDLKNGLDSLKVPIYLLPTIDLKVLYKYLDEILKMARSG
jgi:hypothetical protein